jgi:hypothetical protein
MIPKELRKAVREVSEYRVFMEKKGKDKYVARQTSPADGPNEWGERLQNIPGVRTLLIEARVKGGKMRERVVFRYVKPEPREVWTARERRMVQEVLRYDPILYRRALTDEPFVPYWERRRRHSMM